MEHPELVAQRIERLADTVGKERVICGFGAFAGYGTMDMEISCKKLRAMTERGTIASRRLSWKPAA